MPPSAIDKGKLRSICETNLDKVTVILPTTLAFVALYPVNPDILLL